MARWKLTEPHYLNVPGTKWEMIRQDRSTGKPTRLTFDVPLYLHPESQDDWNHGNKRDGEGYVVVAHEGKGAEGDYIFVGNPTPGMLPIDDEAREISAKFSKLWTPTAGTDDLSQMESFQQKLLMGLVDQMQTVQSAPMPAAHGMEKFMEMMAAMMQQQTAILAQLAGKPSAEEAEFRKLGAALGEVPVVDDAEPLAEAEPTPEEVEEAALAAHEAEVASRAKAVDHVSSRRI